MEALAIKLSVFAEDDGSSFDSCENRPGMT